MSRVILLLFFALALLASCSNRTVLHGLDLDNEQLLSGRTESFKIWLVKPRGDQLELTAVMRSMPEGGDNLETALVELLNGPTGHERRQGFATEIPRGTILLGVQRQNGAVELNLSKRFAAGGGSSSLETRLQQLKRTVAEVEKGDDVYLMIEGQRLSAFAGEGIEVPQPINR